VLDIYPQKCYTIIVPRGKGNFPHRVLPLSVRERVRDSKKNLKKLKKMLDNFFKICYNKDVKRK
jgi:hypothetical protein